MSSPHVEGIQPRLVEFGSSVGENEEEARGGSSASQQAIAKIRIIGPAAADSKRVSRGLTRGIRRPNDNDLHPVDDHNTIRDMTVVISPHTKTTQTPTPETDDDEVDDVDIDDLDSGTGFSPLYCETPIPPLPRARIPPRLGAVSTQPYEPLGEPRTSQGMMLIGRPASTASHIRVGFSPDCRSRRTESGFLDTPSASILSEGPGRITSIEEDLKPLLLCQSMGIKIEVKPADFIPGTTAQIMFHCERCLKHWKLSGQPKAPSECKEAHRPTKGPKYNISMQSHRIMKELEKLPEHGKQRLIKVLSRTGSPGADEELLELVNSVSSGFLHEHSTSPHASRRSRSPEKKSAIKISKDRKSASLEERLHRKSAGQSKTKRDSSIHIAKSKNGSPKSAREAASARLKSSDPDIHPDTPHHRSRQNTGMTLTMEKPLIKHNVEQDVDENIDRGASIVTETSKEHAQVNFSKIQEMPISQLPDNTGLTEKLPSKPQAHKMIPSGEISATGQSIVEFEDIDGTTYHGFMTPAGNFVPIARVDHTGNRLPIAMKPDGGICIVKSYGSHEIAASPDDDADQSTSDIDKGIIEFKDKNGAIVRGYKNQSGQFVPVSQISNDGVERPVMMKTDGKFYLQSLNNGSDDKHNDEVDLSDMKLESLETSASHTAVLPHSQNITEVVSHDGFTYQGFESPKFGFIPTARIDADGARRPVIMNAEGEYTVVNGDGRMIGVKVQCQSDDIHGTVKCTGCRFLNQSQSQTRMLFNALSNTLSDSNDTDVLQSASQVDNPIDYMYIMQIDHWAKTDVNAPPPSRKSSHKFNHMTYKREPDGSIYHGCCQSGQFIPVFRLDEQGYRYPVIKDSGGKLYTIDRDGQNLYTDLDEKGHSTKEASKVVTRELNGNTFEGRYTIDGRFTPMYCIDDYGNKKAVIPGKNGHYIFSGSNGHIHFVKFPGADNKVNLISGFNPVDSAVSAVRIGDDGLKYEGYIANDGDFIPTVRTDKTGYRQMVLINSEDQGYVIGYNGEKELVPFNIPQRATKAMIKKKSLHTPPGKSTQSKCFQGSDDNDDGDLLSSAMLRSSPIKMQSQGNYSVKEDSDVDSLGNGQNLSGGDLYEQRAVKEEDSEDHKENWEQHNRAQSPLKDTNASSSTSLTNPYKDGTMIFREKSVKESSTDICKLPSKMSHSGNSLKLEESAKSAKSQENQLRRSPGARNNKDVTYLGMDNDSNSTSKKTDGQVAVDIVNNKNRNIKEKPIVKNTAVRNVTGRPDTRAGQFKKHVFATPHENLTKTTPLGKETNLLNSQDTGSTDFGDIELVNGGTMLPSLQKKTGLPPIIQKDREIKSKVTEQSSGQQSDSLYISLPDQGHSNQANTFPPIESTLDPLCQIERTPDALPPIEGTLRESKSGKTAGKTIANEKVKNRQVPFADVGPEAELNQDNYVNDQSQSSADILKKYSEFQLTADSTSSPPLLSQPPPPSDKETAYQIAYSTSPNLLGNKSLPIQLSESTPVGQTFSSRQGKSPEPILFTKEPNKFNLSTLPVNCDEDTLLVSKVTTQILTKESLRPTKSIYRSTTTLATRPSNRMHGVTESMPNSVSKIWQQHKRQVEFLRQTFYMPLTPAFTFSMFELPEEYQKHNSTMRQKARQIRTMKKPTSLGKPPEIMLRPPLPLKKAPPPLKTIPYRIKAKIAKA